MAPGRLVGCGTVVADRLVPAVMLDETQGPEGHRGALHQLGQLVGTELFVALPAPLLEVLGSWVSIRHQLILTAMRRW